MVTTPTFIRRVASGHYPRGRLRRVKRRVLSLQVGTFRISERGPRARHALWLAWQPLDRPDHRLLLISRIGAHQGGMRPMVNLWLILRWLGRDNS